jgi:glycosyltransferase involved in cell wall biosynthesis
MLLDSPFESDVRVEKEAVDLMRAGHYVFVLGMEGKGLSSEAMHCGIAVKRRFPAEIKSPFRLGYGDALEQSVTAVLSEEYDVLHCHDYHMLTIGTLAKARRTKPLVYDAHEYLSGWPFYRDSKGLANRLKGRLVWHYEKWAEGKNIHDADRTVTVSQALSDAMTRRFSLRVPPLVVRNIPKIHELRRDSSALRIRFGIPPGRKIIIFSGALYHTDRQLGALFQIVADIENAALLILGSRPRHMEARDLARAQGWEGKQVFFGDYVPDPAERHDLMSGADVGLMHVRTSWEAHRLTFSNKFLEYTFAGLPVVATYQEDCLAIGRKYGHALFYEEDDDATLKKNIVEALRDNAALRRNLPAARTDLSWENEVKKLVDLYAELG